MKKLIFAVLMSMLFAFSASAVMADPGPYDATMTLDGYDTTTDAVQTPNQTSSTESPQIFEAINQVFINAGLVSPAYTSNPDTDVAQVTGTNAYWHDIAPFGDAGNFAVISITAANANTLGVFQYGNLGSLTFVVPTQTGFTFLGDGTSLDPYPGGINPFTSTNFGFALNTVGSGVNTTWYSDPTLNSDQLDHMLAFYLPELAEQTAWIDTDDDGVADHLVTFTTDTYLLAWEDLPLGHNLFDSDYNDTIFLVTKVSPVPEPMTMALMGSGLAAMAGLRRRKVA